MKKIGVIYDGAFGNEEKEFLKQAKKRKIELVFFNAGKEIKDEEIEQKAKECGIILNNSAQEFAIELVKTFEELGKKVVDSSESYYYTEDKWLFFLKCMKNKIPVPKTNLLSQNLNLIKKELQEFNCWPVILKRIEGCCGEFVDKAENYKEAIEIIKKFRKKGGRELAIIAQEMIKSRSYRVLVIDGKIVQTVVKKNKAGWKSTGVYEKKFQKFKVDNELSEIIKKLTKVTKLIIYGIDFLKKEEKWIVLEVNCDPGLDFFKSEKGEIVGKVLDCLKRRI